jgi:hypothetical protein
MSEKAHVALTKCFYCGEGDKILLATRYQRTESGMEPVKDLAPAHGKVIDMEPCHNCEDWMTQGIILIGIDSAKSDPGWNEPPNINAEREHWMPNPWRAGGFAVLKDEAFCRLFGKEFQKFALKHRYMFMEQEAMVLLGILKPDEQEAT